MKKLHILLTCFAALCGGAQADTSYFLLQGPFDPGDSVETFKWKVLYQPGSLSTGQDMLDIVFGTPTDAHITYTTDFGAYEVYKAANNTQGAQYINFGTSSAPSLFAISFTIQSNVILQDSSANPSWSYYVAGGGGAQTYDNSGAWTYSNDGSATRSLSDGSFDGWVFGSAYPDQTATIGDPLNSPLASDFASATVINVVPEPASAGFLLTGALVIGLKRRR